MSSLMCPECGKPIDPDGTAVSQDRRPGNGSEWSTARWVPYVYDLRTNPVRLVHAECFGRSAGIGALVEVMHRQDEIYYRDRARLWELERRQREET